MPESEPQAKSVRVFNSELESGIRCAAVLLAVFPQSCDLQRLVQYSYLIVHSGDVPDGPPSIHPATPHRSGELIVRRRLVQGGLELMATRSVVQRTFTPNGIGHLAGEYALTFLDALSTSYAANLRSRAAWIAERFQPMADVELASFMQFHWKHWGAEFVRPDFVEAREE